MRLRLQPNVRCGDWPRLSAARCWDKVSLISEGQQFTFGQLDCRINLIATTRRRLGVGHGDRVAIFANDTHRYLEVVFACMKLGTVYVPLNPRLAGTELQQLLEVCEPTCVFFSARTADLSAQFRSPLSTRSFCLTSIQRR